MWERPCCTHSHLCTADALQWMRPATAVNIMLYTYARQSGRARMQVHDQLLPTVYTLWRFPNALPSVKTYSEVSPKVMSGQAYASSRA